MAEERVWARPLGQSGPAAGAVPGHPGASSDGALLDLACAASGGLAIVWDVPSGRLELRGDVERATGFARSEVPPLVDWWNGRMHPDDRPGRLQIVEDAFAGGARRYHATYRLSQRNGGCIHLSESGIVERRASDGRPARVVAFVTDVTETRRREQELLHSRTLLERITAASPDLLYVYDVELERMLYANRAALDVLGYTPEELRALATPFDHLVHADDLPLLPAGTAELEQAPDGAVVDRECRILRREGTWRWLRVRETVFARHRDGRVRQVVGVAQDITERREWTEKLQRSEAEARTRARELEALMEAVPACVWVALDPEAKRIGGNRLSYEIARMPAGSNVSVLRAPDEPPLPFRIFSHGRAIPPDDLPVRHAALHGQEVRGAELDFVFDDGTVTTVVGNAAPLYDGEGRLRGAVGAFIDETEKVRALRDLEASRAELAEANRRKDDFMAVLGHELRNPLAPIRHAVALLRSLVGAVARVDKPLAVIDRQVDHLARLVDDLLDLSRVGRGKIILEKQPLAIAAVVARAAEVNRPMADAQGLSLEVDLPPEDVCVVGDPVRLVQILGNLLNNAIKYTPRGGHVWVDARANTHSVLVRVRDDGVGIPPEMLERLFDPFAQAERSLDRAQGGLGIGLSLVRSLVTLHGGHVEATSAGPGQGSAFVVHLPRLRPASPR